MTDRKKFREYLEVEYFNAESEENHYTELAQSLEETTFFDEPNEKPSAEKRYWDFCDKADKYYHIKMACKDLMKAIDEEWI